MTEVTESLVIQRVESALNNKYGISGYQVVSRHRGVVSSSFGPDVDINVPTTLCESAFLHDKPAKPNPNCHLQTILVVPDTGVFHLQRMTNYALVVLTPPATAVDVEVLARLMEDQLVALERQ